MKIHSFNRILGVWVPEIYFAITKNYYKPSGNTYFVLWDVFCQKHTPTTLRQRLCGVRSCQPAGRVYHIIIPLPTPPPCYSDSSVRLPVCNAQGKSPWPTNCPNSPAIISLIFRLWWERTGEPWGFAVLD